MTSQLNVDAIVDKAGSGGTNVKMANTSTYVSEGGAVTQNTVQGLAKCWVQFDGTAGSISASDSLNVGSLTDNGTGNYTVTFSNNMGAANYSVANTGNAEATIGGVGIYAGIYNITSTSSCNPTYRRNNANADSNPACVQVFGDLA